MANKELNLMGGTMDSEMLRKAKCEYCDLRPLYKDGKDAVDGPIVCPNHSMKLSDPRAIDPISDKMAKEIRDFMSTPDPEVSDDGLDGE